MSAAVVQNTAASTSAASVTVSLGSDSTSGNTLVSSICMEGGASVSSITDGTGNRWIRAGHSYQPNAGVEMWYARGIAGGATTVTVNFTTSVSAGVNVLEASGLWFVDPLDQWTQYPGTDAASVTPVATTPRATGELVVACCANNASVGAPVGGFTALNMTGGSNFAAAYDVLSGSVTPTMYWPTTSASAWATIQACFQTGVAGNNPNLQFPETLVQISTTDNFLAPIQGSGVWTNISSYVESMSLGPIGRMHELDRVNASTAQFNVDARDGSFNPWNTDSFLYNGGNGLQPMNPIKVTAAWDGVTHPMFYGYFQGITPQIHDVLNVDAQIHAVDILQILSLKYLANDNYAQLVKSDGGSNLAAYYRLGDTPGSYSVTDSSGNGNTGSLISGAAGPPAYGTAGAFLYDANTSLDLTNGKNISNGGFEMVDNTTQAPTVHNPLSSATEWTFEAWVKWGGGAIAPGSSTSLPGADAESGLGYVYSSTDLGASVVGQLITGPGLPAGTYITGYSNISPVFYYFTSANPTSTETNQTYTLTLGGAPYFLFEATATAGKIGIGVGQYTSASVTTYNVPVLGTVNAEGIISSDGKGNNQTLINGAWHHVAVTYSASVATIYVDGAEDSAISVSDWSDPSSILIGCGSGATYGWAGDMQDAALYSTKLTATQIANHYATGTWFQNIEIGADTGGTSKGRFNKVMAVSGLDSSIMLYVPYKFKTELYAETNPVTTTSGLNYMQTTSETEPGLIFQGPDGMIYAYNRQYQYLAAVSASTQATFGDSPGVLHYDPSLQIVNDDLDIWNDIQVQSGRGGFTVGSGTFANPGAAQITGTNLSGGQLEEWGPAQSTDAAKSASVYGSRTLQGLTSLQFEYDTDALAVAQNYGEWYNFPVQRVQQIKLNSYADGGANLPQMLGRGIMDQVTVEYQGQTPGPQFSQNSVIEQISHHVTMKSGPLWSTDLALSPYELLMKATYLGVFQFGGTSADGVLTL